MPRDCYEELLAPLQEGDVADVENKDIEFDGKNMEGIVVLLNFLYKRFDRVSCVFPCFFCAVKHWCEFESKNTEDQNNLSQSSLQIYSL